MGVGALNFTAFLSDQCGRVVPGSLRREHNIITRTGKAWLANLCRWTAPQVLPIVGTTPDDLALSQQRLRWVAVGNVGEFESVDIQKLSGPLAYSGGAFLKVLPAPAWPTIHSLRYTVTWGPTDFASAAVSIAEAALYVDVDSGSGPGLTTTVSTYPPVAYKRIYPALAKNGANTLTIIWEQRF